MYTDAYDFKRTNHNQSIADNYNTYSRKDYNYLPDINQGVYTNNSLSLVQFDLSSIYNSSRFTDTNDLVLVLPITIVAAYSFNGAIVAPTPGSCNLVSLKSNYVNLVHQCDVMVNGKTVGDLQPYTNIIKNFEMLSEMSADDLKVWGSSYGIGEVLDNPRSVVLNTAPALQGSGLCNNTPFGTVTSGTTSAFSHEFPLATPTTTNGNCANIAITSRLSTFADTTQAGAGQKIYGSGAGNIMSLNQLAQEFKPYYTVINNYMVWYDYAVIRLGSLLESMRNIGLTRRFDAVVRLYINTGALAIPITLAPVVYGQALQSSSTFTNTCPIMINYLPGTAVIPATTNQIVAGCFIGAAPQTSVSTGALAAISLGGSTARNPMNSCRMYYSSIELGDAKQVLTYIESNRAKKVVYRNFVSNFISGVTAGSSYSSLIQSGLTNPVAVIIFPWISNSQGTFLGNGAPPQWGSPYDACTGSPCSLYNLQVTVGGVNQLNTTLLYTFENFLQQVSLANQVCGIDFGVTVGLFDRKWWEMNRPYVVIIRSRQPDMDSPRNINISFTNNNNCSIDLMVFSVFLDSLIIDCDTGRIVR